MCEDEAILNVPIDEIYQILSQNLREKMEIQNNHEQKRIQNDPNHFEEFIDDCIVCGINWDKIVSKIGKLRRKLARKVRSHLLKTNR
jgi:hypothetical protein